MDIEKDTRAERNVTKYVFSQSNVLLKKIIIKESPFWQKMHDIKCPEATDP